MNPSPPENPDVTVRHSIPAALFAALFQALEKCTSSQRTEILNALEPRLNTVFDDLAGKMSLLYAVELSREDKIQGLWLLYLSFLAYPRGDVQMWIGPDIFGNDVENRFRLHLPTNDSSMLNTLQEDLKMLARAVDDAAEVALEQGGSDQMMVLLR